MNTFDDLTAALFKKFDKAALKIVKDAATKAQIPFKNPEVWSTNNNPWIDFDVSLQFKDAKDDLRVRLTYDVERKHFYATVFVLTPDGDELFTRSGIDLDALVDQVFRRYTSDMNK